MSDISLSLAARSTLLSLQQTALARNEAANRLSTGQRVERASDDPVAYFTSSALTNRAGDLLAAKDAIGQGLSAVETTLVGLDTIEDLIDQLRGVAQSAQGSTNAQRDAATQQFDTLREQIAAVAQDTSYGGNQLLTSEAQELAVSVNDRGTEIVIDGSASDADSLGLGTAVATYNGFATDADIQSALSTLEDIRSSLRSTSASYGGDVASLSVRERFNEQLTNTLETGAQKLVEADLNEEAARLLAADVRDGLSLNGLRIVQQGESLIGNLVAEA